MARGVAVGVSFGEASPLREGFVAFRHDVGQSDGLSTRPPPEKLLRETKDEPTAYTSVAGLDHSTRISGGMFGPG